MPRISEFFGIIVSMFYLDHAPPHFHAVYGEHEAMISIDPIRLLEGRLPRRALSLVIEWAALHQDELRQDWQLAREELTLKKIAPLE